MTATPMSRETIISSAQKLAAGQVGGALATMHAEDGTPYVTFVLFHLREDCSVVFASGASPQHSRNMDATPEVSFLIDNRDVIRNDWPAFNRLVVEGRAEKVTETHADYAWLLAELGAKNRLAPTFAEHGALYRIRPHRIVFMRGIEQVRNVVDFERED